MQAQYKMEGIQGVGGGKLKQEAWEVEGLVFNTVKESKVVVTELQDLAVGLEINAGKQLSATT